jgi:hypothetical protein
MTGHPRYDPSETPAAGIVRYCEEGHDGPGEYMYSPWAGWCKLGNPAPNACPSRPVLCLWMTENGDHFDWQIISGVPKFVMAAAATQLLFAAASSMGTPIVADDGRLWPRQSQGANDGTAKS